MAAPKTHFAHPGHELKLRDDYHIPHYCDLCGERLTGSGISCPRLLCGFDLHEECAALPETLSNFFVHPWHELTLSRTAADGDTAGPPAACHVCREGVPEGAFLYRCEPCGFAMHPRCSRLPRTVRSELHPEHALDAVAGMGKCAACGEACHVWVYRCAPCNVDLHIGCLHGARPSSGGGGAGGQAGSLSQQGAAGVIVASMIEYTVANMLDSNNH